MVTKLDVAFTPAEIALLPKQDLSHTTCVVFDILRATSVFVTALANGAASVRPVAEIAEALTARKADPTILLAGERDGLRIRATQAGGVDFDMGNSPREFTPEAVRGRHIISTTTNGTRALRACFGAERVLAGSFLNLAATAGHLHANPAQRILLVCAGTGEEAALEDVLAAGALCLALKLTRLHADASDAAQVAMATFLSAEQNLAAALGNSRNGRRLLANPELRADVVFCSRRDVWKVVPEMNSAGCLVGKNGGVP